MYIYDNISLNSSLNETFFQRKFVEKIKTHFMLNKFSSENRAVYEIMWKKYCRAKQATDGQYNTAHALCMLDN
jgi:hypothetical protein